MPEDVIAGRFALVDPIATGGTSTVWRAWDLQEQRYCAAKVLRQRDSADLVRFTREQSVRLAHSHVLTPYSWAAEDAHVAIATELATGGSAVTLLGDWGPLSTATVADVFDQVLDALAHVHAEGIVHRDVKLANLLLDAGSGRLRIRLADFGIAVRIGDARLTEHGIVIGTPAYLAPEARAGAAPRASQDLYAAALCARALLTGVEPDGRDPERLGTASRLESVLDALLAPDPATRPPSADQARELLAAGPARQPTTSGGEPVTVVEQLAPLPDGWGLDGPTSAGDRSDPAGRRPARPRRRRWLAVALPALALAATSVVVIPTLVTDHQSPTRAGSSSSATPSAPVPSVGPTLDGVACDWQSEATIETKGTATFRCTRNGSTFSWQPA